ncbi:MAG: DNA methyltransferase [Dethiobacteria bacterium]
MSRRKTELDGKTWARYSISIWSELQKDGEERKLKHPAMFPKMLPGRLIEVFTARGDLVLDPFAGTGSTLLAAYSLGRRSLGLEISEEFVRLMKDRLARQALFTGNIEYQSPVHQAVPPEKREYYPPEIIHDCARNLQNHLEPGSVSLCVTSPPYWNILGQRRTADQKASRDYGNTEGDLSLIGDYRTFIRTLGEIFAQVYAVLKTGGYNVVNVMDLRKGADFYPLHIDLAQELCRKGYVLDDIIIWDRRKDYNYLRPLGYPYVFRVNKVHEFLLIFQKRG